jgi:cell wall-associated NlpC family hydrolase
MKRFITITSVLLLLVGCSSAVSARDLNQIIVDQAKTSVEKPVSSVDYRSHLIKIHKLDRNTVRMKQVIKYLMTRVDKTSYVFSGSSPRGWDCSGLVRWTYKRFSLEIPHSANKQAHIGKRVSDPVPGDIVVMAYQGSHNFYHSAIYIGNGKIINAHYQAGTTIVQALTAYKNSQIRYVRIIDQYYPKEKIAPVIQITKN